MDISGIPVGDAVGAHAASVGTLPIVQFLKGQIWLFRAVIRAVIDIIINARFFQKLGEHAIMSEGVYVVARFHVETEIILEKFLRIEKMAAKSLAGGEIAVGLYPHSANDRPAPFLNSFLDLLKHFRLTELDPFVIRCARTGERVVRIFLHAVEGRAKRGLYERQAFRHTPLPNGIEMRIGDQMVFLFHRGTPFVIYVFFARYSCIARYHALSVSLLGCIVNDYEMISKLS